MLVHEMVERAGVTEQLKAKKPMVWVGRMNNIRNRATEIVNNDLIHTRQTAAVSEILLAAAIFDMDEIFKKIYHNNCNEIPFSPSNG